MSGQLQWVKAFRRVAGKCAGAKSDFLIWCSLPWRNREIIHRLRQTVEDHWQDADFAVLKIDMPNAFHLVSRDAVLKQCAIHFPELLPWVSWCYSQHQYLRHPMGQLLMASGVHQGDHLGPLLFALVFNDTTIKISQDPLCKPLQPNF